MKPTPIPPQPGQESVWDYPRPPRLEPVTKHIQIIFNGEIIADTHQAFRVLETSHPPVYYIPPQAIRQECVRPAPGTSWCEWKGQAAYFTIKVGDKVAERVAWCYPRPAAGFEKIAGYLAFYAGPMDSCLVNGEKARPQPGNFYGGWITNDIIGPFKGERGTMGW